MGEHESAQAQLDLDRNRNNQKLKSRFEHIFRKYEHDFTGIGDEFDIHTDQIVVNNGHLEHMRNEADSGTTASSRFVKTFREKLAHEDESTTSEDEEEDDEEGDGSDNGSGTESEDVDGVSQHTPRLPQLFRLLAGEGTAQDPLDVPDDEDSEDEFVSAPASRDQTPAMSETLHATKQSSSAYALARSKRPTANDDTVRALGMSIATQLAKLMGASSKKSKKSKKKATFMHGATDPAWDYPELKQTSKTKRKRSTSPMPQPQLSSSPQTTSPKGRSLWAVHDSAQSGKRRRTADAADVVKPTVRRYGNETDLKENKRCWNCSLTRSPSWRKGPHGQDLCLPCGQYYAHHGRMKGFDSATPPVDEQDHLTERSTPDLEESEVVTGTNDDLDLEDVAQSTQDEEERQHINIRVLEQTPECMPRAEADEPTTPSISYQANTSRPMVSSASKKRPGTRWTVEEDALLIRLKECDQLSWDVIALHFPNRATFAIQKNYSSRLKGVRCPGRELLDEQLDDAADDVETDVDDSHDLDWSSQQDELLVALRDVDGLAWAEIADLLPGHDAKAVERRYALLSGLAKVHITPDLRLKRVKHAEKASTSLEKASEPDQAMLTDEVSQRHHSRQSLPASMPSSSRKSGSGNALLRQALDNSQRRRSYLDAAPLRTPTTQDTTSGHQSSTSNSISRVIVSEGESDSSVYRQHARSSKMSSQTEQDMQHSQERGDRGDVFGERAANIAHRTRDDATRATSETSSRDKRRRTSRAASADAEHNAREALINSFGEQAQTSESTIDEGLLGLARPPALSWAQIVDMAFTTSNSTSMSNQDLFAWIESNYGYYSTAPRGWKNYVRKELRVNDKYELDTARRRNSVWRVKQETVDHPQNDIENDSQTDTQEEAVPVDDIETSFIFDTGDPEMVENTSPRQTSQAAPRHVSFSPVVTVSTPVPVGSKRSRGRSQKQDSQHVSSIEQAPAELEIPDSDPPDACVIGASSSELGTGHGTSTLAASASTGSDSQPSSGVRLEPCRSSPPPLLNAHSPQSGRASLKMPTFNTASSGTAQPSSSPVVRTRKSPASIFKTPKQPTRSHSGGKKKSLSDSARRHSTPIINHRFMTPNAHMRKRVVETPLRELRDPDEDELAG